MPLSFFINVEHFVYMPMSREKTHYISTKEKFEDVFFFSPQIIGNLK